MERGRQELEMGKGKMSITSLRGSWRRWDGDSVVVEAWKRKKLGLGLGEKGEEEVLVVAVEEEPNLKVDHWQWKAGHELVHIINTPFLPYTYHLGTIRVVTSRL